MDASVGTLLSLGDRIRYDGAAQTRVRARRGSERVMNPTLKAVIVEVSGGNVRNNHINLRGAFGLFPDDCFGGGNASSAAEPITLEIVGEVVSTDIDETKAIFRERGAIRRFFENERVVEGDLILVERIKPRVFRVTKASKRGFKYYL
jgi:hypothetical protein